LKIVDKNINWLKKMKLTSWIRILVLIKSWNIKLKSKKKVKINIKVRKKINRNIKRNINTLNILVRARDQVQDPILNPDRKINQVAKVRIMIDRLIDLVI
jgi:hypothetical protein